MSSKEVEIWGTGRPRREFLHVDDMAAASLFVLDLPRDQYDMRSGSSLSAAHASGVVALLLSVAPHESVDSLRNILQRSQVGDAAGSIDACAALQLAGATGCRIRHAVRTE